MGGWDTTVTQGTVITPDIVKTVMSRLDDFVYDFHMWAAYKAFQGVLPVRLGHPTGSSAWHEVDDADMIYGDVDVQLIVPDMRETRGMTNAQAQSFWNKKFDQFVKEHGPEYVHPESIPGHPIIHAGDQGWVQVDLMYHTPKLAKWGRYRVTPERGMKGLLHGNMFSVLGNLLDMSIQHHGVQYKIRDGKRSKFARTLKNYELVTVSTDVERFIVDIFDHEYREITGSEHQWADVDEKLLDNPGVNTEDIKIASLVNGTKGIASSFQLNNMYGKGSLESYRNADDFLTAFITEYEAKAMKDVNSKKRDKAETTEAKARVRADRDKVLTGLEKVRAMFNG